MMIEFEKYSSRGVYRILLDENGGSSEWRVFKIGFFSEIIFNRVLYVCYNLV